jgi:nucleoside permease NupC
MWQGLAGILALLLLAWLLSENRRAIACRRRARPCCS